MSDENEKGVSALPLFAYVTMAGGSLSLEASDVKVLPSGDLVVERGAMGNFLVAQRQWLTCNITKRPPSPSA